MEYTTTPPGPPRRPSTWLPLHLAHRPAPYPGQVSPYFRRSGPSRPAYRAVSLASRRPPVATGDVFAFAARCRTPGGGSMTGLPIIETKATTCRRTFRRTLITDGQIFPYVHSVQRESALRQDGYFRVPCRGGATLRFQGEEEGRLLAQYRSMAACHVRLTWKGHERLMELKQPQSTPSSRHGSTRSP